MVVLAKFIFKDIPKDLSREWDVNTSVFAQLYQGLLLKAAKRNGMDCEEVEARTSKEDRVDETFIYVMCSIAVNKIIDITGFLSSPNSNSIYEALTELNVFLNKRYTKLNSLDKSIFLGHFL